MTKNTQSLSASSVPAKNFYEVGGNVVVDEVDTSTLPCQVFQFGDYVDSGEVLPTGWIAAAQLAAKADADPARRVAMQHARQWAAERFHAEDGNTLRTLRLRCGLSQQAVAVRIGTSQSHIARIEGGADNLNLATCRKLAELYGIDLNTLDRALSHQQQLNAARARA